MRWGFETLGFERIIAGTDPPNIASIRIMEKLGMRFTERRNVDGVEVAYYEIARETFLDGDGV